MSDASRGATMEAVISRMKTIQASMNRCPPGSLTPRLRFVAVSATIPNIQDVGLFLPCYSFKEILYYIPSHMYKLTITLSIYAYILLSEIRITHKNSIVIKACLYVCYILKQIAEWLGDKVPAVNFK